MTAHSYVINGHKIDIFPAEVQKKWFYNDSNSKTVGQRPLKVADLWFWYDFLSDKLIKNKNLRKNH